jgi:hypothetical protein
MQRIHAREPPPRLPVVPRIEVVQRRFRIELLAREAVGGDGQRESQKVEARSAPQFELRSTNFELREHLWLLAYHFWLVWLARHRPT